MRRGLVVLLHITLFLVTVGGCGSSESQLPPYVYKRYIKIDCEAWDPGASNLPSLEVFKDAAWLKLWQSQTADCKARWVCDAGWLTSIDIYVSGVAVLQYACLQGDCTCQVGDMPTVGYGYRGGPDTTSFKATCKDAFQVAKATKGCEIPAETTTEVQLR